MYYPYFRGKQYELITIRENARLLSQSGFVPIIEPVKQSMTGLQRAIDEVKEAGGECIVIVNPTCGDHATDGKAVRLLLGKDFNNHPALSVGILLTESTSMEDFRLLYAKYQSKSISLIHCGFKEGRDLAPVVADLPNVARHIFVEGSCGKLYRRNFEDKMRILLRDGFQKRTNREHPPVEFFSDLHATFREEGMDGFGDFLIVGDDYSESAGPAYAVAIHLTYIDQGTGGEMYVHHFLSDRTDTPTDPAGKFAEALAKLAREVNKGNSPIFKSLAVREFLDLHNNGHFPGLGYVKKLSMQHHIETLADYLRRA